jgi:hypothetical protein
MDKIYADKCDKLSTIEAQNNHTSWGRWFVEDGNLCTWVVLPETENLPVRKCYIYDFAIDIVKNGKGQEFWVNQLSEKNWIGEQGIKDLKRAFKYISKHGKIDIGNELEKE